MTKDPSQESLAHIPNQSHLPTQANVQTVTQAHVHASAETHDHAENQAGVVHTVANGLVCAHHGHSHPDLTQQTSSFQEGFLPPVET